MLASKRCKDDLESKRAEHTNMKNSLKHKAMVDELETVKCREQETEQIVKELRKCSDTELLKQMRSKMMLHMQKLQLF